MKSIGIFSAVRNCGTSMFSKSLGQYLSRKVRTLVIDSGQDAKSVFFNWEEKGSLSYLKDYVKNNQLNKKILEQVISREEKLYYIGGIKSFFEATDFPVDFYAHLFPLLVDFDYVIIDGGGDFQLPLTFSAYLEADERIIVTTQQKKALDNFLDCKNNIFAPAQRDYHLVVSQYEKRLSYYSLGEIEKLYSSKVLGYLPHCEAGWEMEVVGKTFMNKEKYCREVEKIGKHFLEEEATSRGIFNFKRG